MRIALSCLVVVTVMLLTSVMGFAAELVTLSPENYASVAPGGMEREAFWGDYILRNDTIAIVVADPDLITGRSASRWGRQNVAGCIIDMVRHGDHGDRLTAFYPGPLRFKPDAPQAQGGFVDEALAYMAPGRLPSTGKRVTLQLPTYEAVSGRALKDIASLPASLRGEPQPAVEVRYTLEDGWPYVLVELTYTNPTNKPFRPNFTAMLQVDHGGETGLALDGKLFWYYDHWHGQAYGVLADNHQMTVAGKSGARVSLAYVPEDRGAVTIPPGGTYRVVRKFFPGLDLFEVKAIACRELHIPARQIRLEVTAPDGPVADAVVTATADNAVYAMGKTGADGRLQCDLPDGRYNFTIRPFGRKDQTIAIDTRERISYQVKCEAAGVVVARIRSDAGGPIPCKVEFRGVNGTPDPYFFPETGEHQVRNLYYTQTGAFRQILPPGNYEAILTCGPEYDAVRQTLDIVPGTETSLTATMLRTVQTPGWISADLHNHSTVSGETSISYAEGKYTLDPVVDGNSTASQLGRVLNLLCEHVEFAPPTEHNMISSYAPLLEQLGATTLLATCPGIGLTASRRHALTHENAFPVIWRPGAQDGGALQRPEHINQLEWLGKWDNSAEKLIQINQPECMPMTPRKRMDVFDVQALEPIVEQKAIPGKDNRILTWLDLLSQGYRLPAVSNSGAFHNFHGSGGVRNYISSPTDDPAQIQPLDIVQAVRRGHVVMTTGPYLEVELRNAGSEKGRHAIPGDEIVVRGGKVVLHTRVQCPNWIDIDKVQVLLNGAPVVTLTRAANPEAFGTNQVKFDRQIPLILTKDAYLIVVASGTGPNLRARQEPNETLMSHVAVSNPIYVDIDGKGFVPISPLDYKVISRLEFVKPVLAKASAEPGRIDLILKNISTTTAAKDTVELIVDPPSAARILGDAKRAYTIAPGKELTLTFHVVMADEYLQQQFPVVSLNYINPRFHDIGFMVSRSSTGIGRTPAFVGLQVEHGVGSLPPMKSVDGVKASLAQQLQYPVRSRAQEVLARLRFAVAGSDLAVYGQVADAHMTQGTVVWQGSCIEVFGAMLRQPIGQMYLVPQVGNSPAQAYRREQGKIVLAPEIRVASQTCPGGYEIQALIPLSLLQVDVERMERTLAYNNGIALLSLLGEQAEAGKFLLECRVTTVASNGLFKTGTIFRSGAPHVDNLQFGHMRMEHQAQCRLDILRPLSAAPGSKPGIVRLHVKNISKNHVTDRVTLQADVEHAVHFLGDDEFAFSLKPGEEVAKNFQLVITDTAATGSVELIAARSPGGTVIRTDVRTMEILDRPLPVFKGESSLERVQPVLTGEKPYLATIGERTVAEGRIAVFDDMLALDIAVTDVKVTRAATVWQGSCIEVFGAMPGKGIGQVLLAPQVGDISAAGFRSINGEITPDSQIRVKSILTEQGYRIQALIPLSLLQIDPTSPQCLLEVQIDTTGPDGKAIHPALFNSMRAYQDTQKYGRMRLLR